MTIPLPVFKDGRLLTHSAESTWSICNRKYYLRYVLGLKTKHDADPLRFGSAYHLGLECFKKGLTEDQAEWNIRQSYSEIECPPWMEAEEYEVEQEKAVAMIKAYYRRYSGDGIVKYLANEISFDLPIRHPIHPELEHHRFRNAGKIDGVAELPDGRIALVEYKTTSDSINDESDYFSTLLMDSQVSRYFLAATELGYPVSTTVYDVTRKPQIKPKSITKAERQRILFQGKYFDMKLTLEEKHKLNNTERESPKMYGARLLHDMTVERPDFYFVRKEVTRLQSDLDDYRKTQWVNAERIADATIMVDAWGDASFPRNTKACTMFGQCQYFNVCRGILGNPSEGIPEGFKTAKLLHEELKEKE